MPRPSSLWSVSGENWNVRLSGSGGSSRADAGWESNFSSVFFVCDTMRSSKGSCSVNSENVLMSKSLGVWRRDSFADSAHSFNVFLVK